MENILILKHIYLDKYFLFFLLIIILTGNFNYFIAYFLLLFIHELGHALTGIILGYQLEKIVFYPMGGVTIFNLPINISLKRELLILVMGPIFQILGYLFLKNIYNFITIYHYTLLIFNLLPLYPLDGGKILNIVFNYRFNYLNSFKIIYIVSIIVIIFLLVSNFFYFNLNLLIMTILMLSKLINAYKNRNYYYQKLLLERYLYNYKFNRIKNITSINKFYRDRYHYINLIDEKKYLKNYFKNQ